MAQQGRYGSLDAIRGLAALGVVLFHYNFVALGAAPFAAIMEPVYEAGHYLVDLFFVLSGYLLASIYAGNRNFPALVWRRIARLVPLHWATLVLVLGLRALMADAGIPRPDENGDAYHFVLNLLLLNSVGLQQGFSFNTPSWSISVEWVVNLALFALIACGVRRMLWPALALVVVSAGLLLQYRGHLSSAGMILGFLDATVLRGMVGFFMGTALASLLPIPRLPQGQGKLAWDAGFLIASGGMLAAMASEDFRAARGADFLLPMLLMPVMIASSLRGRIVPAVLSLPPLRILGEISYSIYLIHFPMLIVLILAKHYMGIDAAADSLAQLGIYLAMTLGLSCLSWRYFEVPMQSWLNQWPRPMQPPSALMADSGPSGEPRS